MADLEGLVVRRLVEQDRARWIEAFEEVFGRPLGGIASGPHFDWCYLSHGKLWGMVAVPEDRAEPGGPIAASYSMIPRRFWIDGRERLGALSLDTLTTSAWRKRGLFVHLARECYAQAAGEGLEFVYGFPNPNSVGGFVKHLGWQLLPSPPVRVQSRPLHWVAGWLRRGGGDARRGGVRARVLPCVDERLDDLWRRSRDRLPGWAVRDASFYRWRVARPGARYELSVAEQEDGALLAACLTAVVPRRGGARAYLLDLLAPAEHDETLAWLVRRATARLAAKAHVTLTQVRVSTGSPFRRVLEAAGFRRVPARIYPELNVGWVPLSDGMRGASPPPDGWHVSYVDWDTV